MKISREELRRMINEVSKGDMSYNAADYIPGFEEVKRQLVAMTKEVLPVEFGTYTELIHREAADALSSIELVLATLREVSIEYRDMGGMIGRLRPRSETPEADE